MFFFAFFSNPFFLFSFFTITSFRFLLHRKTNCRLCSILKRMWSRCLWCITTWAKCRTTVKVSYVKKCSFCPNRSMPNELVRRTCGIWFICDSSARDPENCICIATFECWCSVAMITIRICWTAGLPHFTGPLWPNSRPIPATRLDVSWLASLSISQFFHSLIHPQFASSYLAHWSTVIAITFIRCTVSFGSYFNCNFAFFYLLLSCFIQGPTYLIDTCFVSCAFSTKIIYNRFNDSMFDSCLTISPLYFILRSVMPVIWFAISKIMFVPIN